MKFRPSLQYDKGYTESGNGNQNLIHFQKTTENDKI